MAEQKSQEASEAWQDVVAILLRDGKERPLQPYYDADLVDKARAADAQQIAALKDNLTELEMLRAEKRGTWAFLNGQPREMAERGGEMTNDSQANFAWCLGYDTVADSALWKELVGRADRTADRADAAEQQIAALRADNAEMAAQLMHRTDQAIVIAGLWQRLRQLEADGSAPPT